LIKNSQPFGKNCQKTAGGGDFLTHTVDAVASSYLVASGTSWSNKLGVVSLTVDATVLAAVAEADEQLTTA